VIDFSHSLLSICLPPSFSPCLTEFLFPKFLLIPLSPFLGWLLLVLLLLLLLLLSLLETTRESEMEFKKQLNEGFLIFS